MEQVVTDGGAALRIARLVTEVLAPVVLIFVVTLIVCLHAAGLPRGLVLAFVAMVFAGGIPYSVIRAIHLSRLRFVRAYRARVVWRGGGPS